MKVYPKKDLLGMLAGLEIPHEGRHHSGIGECICCTIGMPILINNLGCSNNYR